MDFLCLLVYSLAVAAGLLVVKKKGPVGLLVSVVILTVTGVGLAASAPMLGGTVFGSMRALAWGIFLAAPLGLAGAAVLLRSPLAAGGSALLLGLGFDAFIWEPQALEVNRFTITSDTLDAPLRIAVVADLQTDEVGAFEREALEAAMAESPDLVLFPGDYLQVPQDRFDEETAALNELFLEVGLSGVPHAAVQGDVDVDGWERAFDGTRGALGAGQYTLEGVQVTALSLHDSRDPDLQVQPREGFHIVLGHAPDFALTRPPADLLIAGHTHGGQVVLPGFGPLMTLSEVPREQASGHTALEWGADLFVSRGVGMERMDAPRLRLFCRPEVMVIDVVPEPTP